jgi:hypothetical protein
VAEFFTPPDGFPEVPPEPATPPPDFPGIGTSFTLGAAAAAKDLGWAAQWADWVLQIVARLIGFLLSLALKIFAYLMKIMGNVTDEAGAGYGAIVAATLHELFGVTVDPATVNTRASGPERAAVAASLGQAIIGTMFSSAPVQAAGGIPPSDAAANNFLRVMMNMELNGWLESWFADAATYHLLEKYGDLKDGVTRILGLGRMSRQVFAPPLKVLVHDPYQALLDQKYRPKHVDVQTAMRAFHRGDVDRAGLSTILGNQGYTEQEIDWAVIDHAKFIPNADLGYLVDRGIWTRDQAAAYLRQQGWAADGANYVLEIEADKRVQKYRDEMVSIATDAYVRGEITADQLSTAINNAGTQSAEGLWAADTANLKRSVHVTHLSRGDIEHGIKDGVMNFNDLKAWALRNNMPLDEEVFLELAIQVDENKAAGAAAAKAAAAKAKADAQAAKTKAAQEKADAAKAQAADKGITVAEAEALVRAGNWTFAQLEGFLTSKGYGPDAIAGIEALLHEKIDAAAAAGSKATGVRTAAKARGLNLAQTEKAVVDGILTIDQLTAWLTSQGFDPADAAVIVQETQRAADDAKLRAATKAAASAEAGKRGISLPALERAVRLHITPIQTYTTALQNAGFDSSSVDLLTATLAAQMAQDAAAKASKGTTTGAPAAKVPTLAQIEQEVAAGVRPIGDYSAALLKAGYSADDTAQLAQLLQHKLDHSTAAAALHSDAVGQAVKRGIDLSQAEAAVLGGINSMDDYDAMLTTLGYDDVDRATLDALLFAKVQAKAAKDAGSGSGSAPAA